MIQPSARVERLLLLFPLACAVVAAFGESLPLSAATPVQPSAQAAAAASRGALPPGDSVAHHDETWSAGSRCAGNCVYPTP